MSYLYKFHAFNKFPISSMFNQSCKYFACAELVLWNHKQGGRKRPNQDGHGCGHRLRQGATLCLPRGMSRSHSNCSNNGFESLFSSLVISQLSIHPMGEFSWKWWHICFHWFPFCFLLKSRNNTICLSLHQLVLLKDGKNQCWFPPFSSHLH